MPKPLKKAAAKTSKATKKSTTPKRPSSDPMVRARQQMAEQMEKFETSAKPWDKPTTEPEVTPPHGDTFAAQLSAHMKKLGSKGGKISGAKRMNMPEKQRKEIARKAAAARWAKTRR